MDSLIEALTIFRKYTSDYPTHRSDGSLSVRVNPDDVSDEDKQRLGKLGFFPSGCTAFYSYRFS